MGTLDPQGEGVLILGVGKATRLFDYYLHKDKVYEAEFSFGSETDTLDGEGRVTACGGRVPSAAELADAIKGFVGKQMQLPPAYSAKKIGGQKAYDLARGGKSFTLDPAEVEVYGYELLSLCGSVAKVGIHCSSGTYIRSLCRDLAHSLNTYATMTAIKRTRAGGFLVEDSVPLDELDGSEVMTLRQALPELEFIDLPKENYLDLCNGRKITGVPQGKYLVGCNGETFGIGESDGETLRLTVYMRET